MNTRQQSLLLNLGVPLLLIGVAGLLIPIADAFQFSSDEGLELAKVDLYTRGFQLYDEIWNDQPPLPTVLWAKWLTVFGHSILSARLLTLCFGTLLLWAFVHSIWLTNGFLPALLGGVGLIFSEHFVPMSTAVMMGVPSLSLAMVSSACLLRSQRHWIWLIGSGLCFAVSAQLKAFTLFLIPVLLGYLGIQALAHPKTASESGDALTARVRWLVQQLPWGSFLVWMGTFAIATFLMIMVLPSPSTAQTVGAHFNQNLREAAGWKYGIGRLLEFFIKDPDYWFFTFFGLWSLRRRKLDRQSDAEGKRTTVFFPLSLVFPLLWLIAAFLVLLWHRPIHFHYYLLISIPLAWLAAVGLSEAIQRRKPATKERWLNLRRTTISGVAVFCLYLAVIGVPIKSLFIAGHGRYAAWKSGQYFEVLPPLMEQQQQTKWLFTDVLMYSFYAKLPVPPEIAVFSSKRLTAGNLTMPELHKIFDQYEPEQVVLGRFDDVREALQPKLNQHYQQLKGNDTVTYYRRRN